MKREMCELTMEDLDRLENASKEQRREEVGCVETILFKEGVTHVGGEVLRAAKNLRKIVFPSSLVALEEGAFEGSETLEDVEFGEMMVALPNRAFSGCKKLKRAVLGKGLRLIGYDAFKGCPKLEEVMIPDEVVEIGSRAFFGCAALQNVSLPKMLWKIGEGAFYSVPGLINKFIYSPDGKTLLRVLNPTGDVVIPEGVEVVGENALMPARRMIGETVVPGKMTSVTLPSSLRKIDEYAFAFNAGLTEVVIPDGVEKVGSFAFEACEGLKSVRLPKQLSKIEFGLFADCLSLASVCVPELVKEIERRAFDRCRSLVELRLPAGLEELGVAFSRCESLASIEIPSNVKRLRGDWGMGGCFAGCKALKSVVLHEGLEEIEQAAFRGCEILDNVVIPASVNEIGDGAFADCKALKNVTFLREDRSELQVSASAFENSPYCYSRGEVGGFKGRVGRVCEVKHPFVVGYGVYYYGPWSGWNEIEVEAGVRFTIADVWGEDAYSCTTRNRPVVKRAEEAELEAVKDNERVRSRFGHVESFKIPLAAFDSGLVELLDETEEDVEVPEASESKLESEAAEEGGLTEDGVAALFGGEESDETSSECEVNGEETQDEKIDGVLMVGTPGKAFEGTDGYDPIVRVRDGVTGVGYAAFNARCHLREVQVPDSVEVIDTYAFNMCESLRKVSLGTGLHVIASAAFRGCRSLRDICLPAGIVGVGANSFSGCAGLSEILFPDSLVTVGESAFGDCTGLRRIVFGKGMKRICDKAFCKCLALQSVVLPKGLEGMGRAAFDDCWSLKTASIPATVKEVGEESFCDCFALESVTLASGVEEIRRAAFRDCRSLSRVKIPSSVREIHPEAFAGCVALTKVTVGPYCQIAENAFPETCEVKVRRASKKQKENEAMIEDLLAGELNL